jgi:hypothetical protein
MCTLRNLDNYTNFTYLQKFIYNNSSEIVICLLVSFAILNELISNLVNVIIHSLDQICFGGI